MNEIVLEREYSALHESKLLNIFETPNCHYFITTGTDSNNIFVWDS